MRVHLAWKESEKHPTPIPLLQSPFADRPLFFQLLSKSCAPWKKSPIAFGKDGIKSHSPPANAHCCRSFFHVWSQAYISKTNNLVSFLTVIHNANKTACERAWNPKRRLTARRGRKKEEKKEPNNLGCLPPASLISIFLLFLRLPLSLFSDCFSTLFYFRHIPLKLNSIHVIVVTTARDLCQRCCYLLAYWVWSLVDVGLVSKRVWPHCPKSSPHLIQLRDATSSPLCEFQFNLTAAQKMGVGGGCCWVLDSRGGWGGH